MLHQDLHQYHWRDILGWYPSICKFMILILTYPGLWQSRNLNPSYPNLSWDTSILFLKSCTGIMYPGILVCSSRRRLPPGQGVVQVHVSRWNAALTNIFLRKKLVKEDLEQNLTQVQVSNPLKFSIQKNEGQGLGKHDSCTIEGLENLKSVYALASWSHYHDQVTRSCRVALLNSLLSGQFTSSATASYSIITVTQFIQAKLCNLYSISTQFKFVTQFINQMTY